MTRKQNSRLYLKGHIGGFYHEGDFLSRKDAIIFAKKLKKSGRKVRIKYNRKYEEYQVWAS